MLGPRPGAKKRANKLNVSGLGRSLVNQKKKELPSSDRYTTEMNVYGSQSALRSVTEQKPLEELLSTAELAGTDFTTERTAAVRVIMPNSSNRMTAADRKLLIKQHYDNAGKLTVPRRPQWTKEMSAIELDNLERDAFLAWRRSLAQLQENEEFKLALTPFERNLEVWRQLWRVIERSDLVVQIVDARNPLLYRSADLDNYVHELKNKTTLLLVNKADLLSDSQRESWKEYFVKNSIPFAFYSAKIATEANESEADKETTKTTKTTDESEEAEESGAEEAEEAEEAKEAKESTEAKEAKEATEAKESQSMLKNTTRILTVNELEALFSSAVPASAKESDRPVNVGLVGYPNVGKSSSINSLIGSKKVSVSSTPGKTKHFQTLHLSDEMILCDCPGLVFPNFSQTKAELVCQGVLPIDQLRDYMSPTGILVERIPKPFLESVYGIRLHTNPVTALDFLNTYAKFKGFTRTGGGEPDASRAARLVLKDYVNAKLPYCSPPPDYTGTAQEFNKDLFQSAVNNDPAVPAAQLKNVKLLEQEEEEDLDRDFFLNSGSNGTATMPFHLKGQKSGAKSKKHNKGRKAAAK